MKTHGTRLAILLAAAAAAPMQLRAITFDEWRALHFTTGDLTDGGISGYTADPDGDGRANWMEFGLNTDPFIPDATGEAGSNFHMGG